MVVHRLTLHRERAAAFRVAAGKFRLAFASVIALPNSGWLAADFATVHASLSAQQAAFIEFIPFADARLDKAWAKYRQYCEQLDHTKTLAARLYGESDNTLRNPAELFKKLLNKVLVHAYYP